MSKEGHEYTKEELDNHTNQMNRNHDSFWQSRGYAERPENWETHPSEHQNPPEPTRG